MRRLSAHFDPVESDTYAYLDREDQEPETDPELDSLEETPEGQGLKPDQRDATRRPPAYLNPRSVLRNRRRVQQYLATGEWTWPKFQKEQENA
jgi:hypothetical protein